jgi:hypothetical protein
VRAHLHAVGRHGGRAAPPRPAAPVAGVGAAAAGLRRRRHVAAVRADVHQLPDPARPGRRAAARGGPRRSGSAGARRRADRDAPGAGGALLRRVPARRGRGGAAGALALLRPDEARGPRAARAADPAGGARRDLRARALRDGARSADAPRGGGPAARSARAREGHKNLGQGPQQVPVPVGRAGALRRGDLRSRLGRDRARLHRGLPLLPGRHDLPPGARARSGLDRRQRHPGHQEGRLRRDLADVAVDR